MHKNCVSCAHRLKRRRHLLRGTKPDRRAAFESFVRGWKHIRTADFPSRSPFIGRAVWWGQSGWKTHITLPPLCGL